MSINIEPKESFEKAPPGMYQAVCCEIVDLGLANKSFRDTQTQENKTRQVHEYQYIFQLNKISPETGKRYEIRSKPFNAFGLYTERGDFRPFLLQWRGHDLTAEEMKPPGVDIDLTGRNAMISVVHNVSGDRTYVNIGSITPLMEGMAEIQSLDYEPKAEAIRTARANAASASGNAQPQTTTDAVPTGQPTGLRPEGHPQDCKCDKCHIPF